MKLTGALTIFLLLVIGIIFSRCGRNGDAIDTVATPISSVVEKIRISHEYYNRKVQLKTKVFYRANENRRAWLNKSKPNKMYEAFVEEVKESAGYGFNPEDYKIHELEEMVDGLYDNRQRTRDDLANADIRITASFFLFTTHMLEGRVRYPGAREFLWVRGMPLENDIALLLKMETASDLRKEIQSLQPQDPQYKELQKALAEYRELEKADTLDALPAKLRLKPGDEHPLVPLIKKKLSLTDYRGKISETELTYDEKIVDAVKAFQNRHGINPDGILDKETIHFLNMPIKEKADLIAINLERLRWRPHLKREKDEIVVNVPEYMLRAYKNGKEKLSMRVVLGSEYTPTPVFQDTIKYIVFSPTWNVPKSIIQEEFLPKLISNPEHFNPDRFKFYKDGQEIDPLEEEWDDEDIDTNAYTVVENPGDANSLGRVKFIMPNDFSIYLHDTPADKLFGQEERALSHGCIRLEHPEEFAHYLLDGEKGWTEKEIQDAMSSEKPRQVNLQKPYPVYIVYRTAWVDDNGKVHFRNDIYGHDKRHLARLPSDKNT